jgi:hypothetical protein
MDDLAAFKSSSNNDDLVDAHERFLGHGLPSILNDFQNQNIDIGQLRSGFLRRSRQKDARVIATFGGIVGDSGTERMEEYFFLQGGSLRRVLSSEETFRIAIEDRQLLRTALSPTICEGVSCMANNIALDNRTTLPPYAPVQRNEDGVFGFLVTACLRGSYSATPGFAVAHCPLERRNTSIQTMWQHIGEFRTNDLLCLLLSAFTPSLLTARTDDRICALGRQLQDVARFGATDFQEFLRNLCWKKIVVRLNYLSALSQRLAAKPPWFQVYLDRHQDLLEARLRRQDIATPADLGMNTDNIKSEVRFQSLASDFGLLLEAWPAIWASAKSLRRGETTFAVPA